ncbi:MAG: MFS transporter [Enterobacterales bacterium]|nr:MFS transporter [Enterobacterales bacterium]
MIFTLPSGMIRALGGYASDKLGARTVNWWVFWVSAVCLFFLSYPETHFVIKGVEGNIEFNIALDVWVFTSLVFIVGIALGFGKASVYKLLNDYYPENMGSVGGMVGVLGGLGGFTLPIFFGLLSDYTNIRSSNFMLMFGLVSVCMIWMNYSIIHAKKKAKFYKYRNKFKPNFQYSLQLKVGPIFSF